LALQTLIGKSEDISRFDFAITAARDEVSIDEINARRDPQNKVTQKYTGEICRQLILWAWSRKPEDIIFEEAAVDLILEYAVIQGKKYSSKIPLVEGANQRIKLAKLAVAVACRVFSTDASGEKVVVGTEHVKFAYQFLESAYNKPSLDYAGFSGRESYDAKIAEGQRDIVLKYLDGFPQVAELFDRQEFVWPKHLEEQLGLDRTAAAEHISTLSSKRMVFDANGRGYKKSAAFIQLLREWKSKNHE
jgi:hypothetical protein